MHLGVGVTNSQIQKHTNLETHTPKFFWSRILFGWFSSSPPLFLTVAGSDNLCPHHHKISAQNHVWNNWVWEKNESEAGVGGSHWRSQHYHYLCLLSSSICWMHKTVFFMICRDYRGDPRIPNKDLVLVHYADCSPLSFKVTKVTTRSNQCQNGVIVRRMRTKDWKLFMRRMLAEATMGCRYWGWRHWGCRLSNLSCSCKSAVAPVRWSMPPGYPHPVTSFPQYLTRPSTSP